PVGESDVHGVGVGGRVHGDRLDSELVRRPDDAHGDLAPVCNEDSREHAQKVGGAASGSSSKRSCPYSTASALSTWIARTRPSVSAFSSLKSFIASMRHSVCPVWTASPTSTNTGDP